MMRIRGCVWFLGVALLFFFAQNLSAAIEAELFSGLRARSIGPANMSGRIGAIDVVASNPNIIFVGAATGGLWKSEDGGLTWKPVFDDQPASSIGAIAINQANPSIIWVGTGEAAQRNSSGVGRGVFLSLDGGKTWKSLGLEKTEKISKILLDPRDPNVAYVGACGTTWGENPERGVFKTVDGGRTWEKILYVDEKTGVADMAMAPDNPNKIIAAMWEHRRWPWFFKSGGPGSGLYITVDGGRNWKRLTDEDGLPEGELGRMGVAFAASRPNIVYALIECKKNGLYRSTDGGFTWQLVNDESNVNSRPFYYSRLWVNPVNENIIYILHSQMLVSEDAGKTFRPLASFFQSHSDYHAMWTHPDGEMLVVGNDGGVVISTNRGQSWRFVTNLPLGQFYHVSYDMQLPYCVYGGLQDNGSWMGPAYVLKERFIASYLWKSVGGGDGFDTEPDPERPGAGYGMSQGGNLYYFDTNLGTSRTIVPTESDVKHRYNWNAGFAVDPF
ncbi:MAG: WD40/YVTN/BNR-like repeat-containing protein, partial [Candidatus Aminicenantales bacterium]